jgi:hypothetical protein
VEAGLGLYATSLSIDSRLDTPGGTFTLNGTMLGMGFGGTLGAAMEFPLGDSMAFGGYLRGRFATTSGIQGTFEDQFGDQYELGLAKNDEGIVSFADVDNIGTGGIEWASIDYTGAEGGIFLVITY